MNSLLSSYTAKSLNFNLLLLVTGSPKLPKILRISAFNVIAFRSHESKM